MLLKYVGEKLLRRSKYLVHFHQNTKMFRYHALLTNIISPIFKPHFMATPELGYFMIDKLSAFSQISQKNESHQQFFI